MHQHSIDTTGFPPIRAWFGSFFAEKVPHRSAVFVPLGVVGRTYVVLLPFLPLKKRLVTMIDSCHAPVYALTFLFSLTETRLPPTPVKHISEPLVKRPDFNLFQFILTFEDSSSFPQRTTEPKYQVVIQGHSKAQC
jgi:hypothetical protein